MKQVLKEHLAGVKPVLRGYELKGSSDNEKYNNIGGEGEIYSHCV